MADGLVRQFDSQGSCVLAPTWVVVASALDIPKPTLAGQSSSIGKGSNQQQQSPRHLVIRSYAFMYRVHGS